MTGFAARLTGAGLLVASAAIHLDLYLTGYRSIPVIGWLFLLQVITGFALALVVLAVPWQWWWWGALAGAAFAIATFGGYLLSVWIGLFGFREVRTTSGIVAGIIEVAAFGVLLAAVVLLWAEAGVEDWAGRVLSIRLAGRDRSASLGGAPGWDRSGRWVRIAGWTGSPGFRLLGVIGVPLACVGALGVLAGTVATATGSPTATAGNVTLRTARIGDTTVLTNSKGFTLYLFVPDGTGRSVCYGSCAAYWPPVTGKPEAGPGVTGTLGTTMRTDGSLQVTYDGHPLYTYVGDSAPGQANGNGLNLNGGLWREITVG
jgi:predicted lipoprotein with Yx(FWY)xxD motif